MFLRHVGSEMFKIHKVKTESLQAKWISDLCMRIHIQTEKKRTPRDVFKFYLALESLLSSWQENPNEAGTNLYICCKPAHA